MSNLCERCGNYTNICGCAEAESLAARLAEAERLIRECPDYYHDSDEHCEACEWRERAKVFLRPADSAPAVCPHGIRSPWECRPCADAAYEAHQRTSASASGEQA